MKAFDLTCNGQMNSIQIEDGAPVFGWKLPAEDAAAQSSYQIRLYQEDIESNKWRMIWDSGRIKSGESIQNPYRGEEALKCLSTYQFEVKFWNEQDEESEWSDAAQFETGLMGIGWKADWIGYDEENGNPYDPSQTFYCADDFEKGSNQYYLPPLPYMRHEFRADKKIKKARIYMAALGLLEVQVNGRKAGEDLFVSGLSDYKHTVYYRAYDVTDLVREGENAVGVILADGWYAGYMGLTSREWYGSKPRAMVQLELYFDDGTAKTIVTDGSWKASYGPLLESDIFQGETYDANRELTGFSEAGFDDRDWKPVVTGDERAPGVYPIVHPGPPVVEQERIPPAETVTAKDHSMILDFGKILTGVVALKLKGPKGGKVTIRHAEMLDENQKLYLRGNRSARCLDTYILKGTGEESCQPRFTYHGFRYAEIILTPGIEITEVRAVRISTELIKPTEFHCSNETVNQVFQIIKNTQLCNEFEVPTDCCARDERLGWGTEGNHFTYAMSYFSHQEAFIRKWTTDIWDGQHEDGGLEAIAPSMMMKDIEQFVGDLQSNHGIHMLYALWQMYGDIRTFRRYQSQAEKYFEFLERNADRHIRFATGCDWLGILEETDHSDILHGYGDGSPGMIGTAHYAVAVCMMQRLLKAAGEPERAKFYGELYEQIRRAFCLNFVARDGSLRRGGQGDYVMALAAGLIPTEYEHQAVDHLVRELTKDGFVRWKGGTSTSPYFLYVMRKYRKTGIANQFLSSVRYPGIGYMIAMGATAVWERWDALFEDGTMHPQPMNAWSHIGFTTVGEYLISGLAGIDAAAPGFRRILIQPGPSREVTRARATLWSNYGEIAVDWIWEQGRLKLTCKIPGNTKAQIQLPSDRGTQTYEAGAGVHEYETILTDIL
ncbi:family 78 glycoside hydrolase catalytic domain [Diplocloster modestus]|uniref:alpha-L-rhamnosidase n=1 Tax=Diplocloster modestus TaxID=2850322 RepID=A0ABS6K4C5_9FIRM|nr:family 78 glycoside hydrolase catalytic domain [Diplocloster modestus]MBU9725340.1 glycoside hydrolase family 78 protein [Diplocloster modestus]